MTLAYSQTVNQARLDAIETSIGPGAKLRIYTGTAPVVGGASTGTLLVEMTLNNPTTDWMAAASGAAPATSKAKLGTWSGTAVAAGTVGYFRIVPSAAAVGAAGEIQGTCAASGADMNFDNAVIAVSQVVTVNTFTLTAGNQVA
jgi:hypothetical protein